MSAEEKSKIIVDDDWKTRVQAEKEQMRESSTQGKPEGACAPRGESTEQMHHDQLPPPSFDSLVSMLVTQALAALGQIPIGEKQEPVVMLDHAKHSIDLLGILEEKTKGNLSAVEAEMLSSVLHELRMVFVAMESRGRHVVQSAAGR
jgi:hypothetical protein